MRWIKFLSLLVPLLLVCVRHDELHNQVIFLSVGQGDATLVQYHGKNILIDGGPTDLILQKLDQYLGIGVSERYLDLVILTHPHADHVVGLIHAVRRFKVGQVVLNSRCAGKNSNQHYEAFLGGNESFSIDTNQRVVEVGDINISFLMPATGVVSENDECPDNINNQSLIFIVEVGGLKILFTGDAEAELEYRIIASGKLAPVEIFQGGHHCSESSNTEQFLTIIDPNIVICSTGKDNRFGHPSISVVNRFSTMGIDLINLAISGDYIVKLE